MKRICIACIEFYRKKLSKLKGKPSCKYYPTCSEYAMTAFDKHGFFKGACLSLYRILRCNPFSHGGIDYVPGTDDYYRIKFESKKEKETKHNEDNN